MEQIANEEVQRSRPLISQASKSAETNKKPEEAKRQSSTRNSRKLKNETPKLAHKKKGRTASSSREPGSESEPEEPSNEEKIKSTRKGQKTKEKAKERRSAAIPAKQREVEDGELQLKVSGMKRRSLRSVRFEEDKLDNLGVENAKSEDEEEEETDPPEEKKSAKGKVIKPKRGPKKKDDNTPVDHKETNRRRSAPHPPILSPIRKRDNKMREKEKKNALARKSRMDMNAARREKPDKIFKLLEPIEQKVQLISMMNTNN